MQHTATLLTEDLDGLLYARDQIKNASIPLNLNPRTRTPKPQDLSNTKP